MRAYEFITENKLLREYKRDITVRQFGNKILNAWKRGEGSGHFSELIVLGLDDNEATDENIVDRIIGWIEKSDPTPSKGFVPWLAREYANGNIKRIEDLTAYIPLLRDYSRYKTRGDFPQQYKDIMKLNAGTDQNSLHTILMNYAPEERKDRDMDRGTSTVIYEDNDVRVIVPRDIQAACYYGRGTRWCTAATKSTNYFERYNHEGPLYIILPKQPQHEGEKYQLHFPSNQVMDEDDNPISIGEILNHRFPQLKEVFEKLNAPLHDYVDMVSDETLMKLYEKLSKLVINYFNNDEIRKQLSDWFHMDSAEELREELQEYGEPIIYQIDNIFPHIMGMNVQKYKRLDQIDELLVDYENAMYVKNYLQNHIRIDRRGETYGDNNLKSVIPVNDFEIAIYTRTPPREQYESI